jgi:hypothetical protein
MNEVNHPRHYNECGPRDADGSAKYEAIKIIEDWGMGFCLGNALKYICRCGHKGNTKQDLEKALWYIDRACQNAEHMKSITGRTFTLDEVAQAWELTPLLTMVVGYVYEGKPHLAKKVLSEHLAGFR